MQRRNHDSSFRWSDSFRYPEAGRASSDGFLHIATNPGDLVLDSFAGSGTTGAVAHKMGRRWIMVELGEHCHTHIIPRLKKVIDGEDPGGITEAVGWKGGGGFRYYRLAPSLLEKDKWGNWVISKEYNAAMLAEARLQAGGLHLRAQRHGLLAARPLDRARLHLRHHAEPEPRAAPAAERRGRAGANAAGPAARAFRGKADALPEPDGEEDPQGRARALRMGPRRLQPARWRTCPGAAKAATGEAGRAARAACRRRC